MSTTTTFEDNNDDLLKLLTDSWDTPLKEIVETSKWTRDYLTKLTSLPLDSLLHEPTELREEQAKAKRDAQQLAFRDYPCFLHAQTCRHQVEETLDGLDVHLGEFLSSVPELQEACEIFSQHAKEIKEERGKITRVLEHQNVLTDLLEIPQLMETCVWNGYYSEAMDLASHVRLLQVRYPLYIIRNIHQQVQSSSDLMLVQLISHLRKPIRLAAAMNVVGFLRRMDVFDSETELRMVFLRCRHDFLQQRLTRLKRDMSEESRQRSTDAFEHLKKFVDVMREQMFEIGTQYISIFSNEQGTLLSDYMVHVIELIKAALYNYLPMIEDTSALASLLTQLQYCGMSLGRIGLDFRHIFVHSFEEAVQPMILRWIDNATEDLVQKISKAAHESTAPSAWMSSKIISQNSSNTVSNRDEVKRHAFQPPMLLVGYPSLAIFTNGILSAFNALRLLPAISLYVPIHNHLEACFLEIGTSLRQYCDQAASYMPDEVTYLQSYSAAYVRCCLPYLKSCLADGIYGNLLISSASGEDMEVLLAAYLPIMKKKEEEKKEEEKKEEKEEEVLDENVYKNDNENISTENEASLNEIDEVAEIEDAKIKTIVDNEDKASEKQGAIVNIIAQSTEEENQTVNTGISTENKDDSAEKSKEDITEQNIPDSSEVEAIIESKDKPAKKVDSLTEINEKQEKLQNEVFKLQENSISFERPVMNLNETNIKADNEATEIDNIVDTQEKPTEKEFALLKTDNSPEETEPKILENKENPTESKKEINEKSDIAEKTEEKKVDETDEDKNMEKVNDLKEQDVDEIKEKDIADDMMKHDIKKAEPVVENKETTVDKKVKTPQSKDLSNSKEEEDVPKKEEIETTTKKDEKEKKPNTQKAKHNNNNSKKKK